MLHPAYERIVQYASSGDLENELHLARNEYIERTGALLESDDTYEQRLASFLEWYVLDRGVTFRPNLTPARMFIHSVANELTSPELARLRCLTRTRLSLFEYRGHGRKGAVRLIDLLSNKKLEIGGGSTLLGIEAGDVFEGRSVPNEEDALTLSETLALHPRGARRVIGQMARRFRKSDAKDNGRLDVVHRVSYLTNRCHRYRHLDPKEIFAEL